MAFEKVDLPSGAWVELRDPEQTTEAQRRPVDRLRTRIGLDLALKQVFEDAQNAAKAAAAAEKAGEAAPVAVPLSSQANLSDSQLDLLSDFMDATIVALVESWSFDRPITVDGLRSIPGAKDYEKLAFECRKHRDAMFPSFEPDVSPGSPTEASAISGASVEAV